MHDSRSREAEAAERSKLEGSSAPATNQFSNRAPSVLGKSPDFRRQIPAFFPCLCRFYSYRRHSTGSRRDALRAGQTPNTRPTATDTRRPATTAQMGMVAGRDGTKNMMI